MKSVVLSGIRRLEVRDEPMPALERHGDVLLDVDNVGVCGSDLHYYREGRIGDQVVKFPWRIGHELAARVVEAGRRVKNVKVGDRVAVDPLITCGKCDQCRTGRRHTCRSQSFMGCPGQAPGCMAEYVVWPAECCFRIPTAMSMVEATMIEPFAICLHACGMADKAKGASAAVLGSGPMGLGVMLGLKAAGAGAIFATDVLDYRLDAARRCGARWAGNPNKTDVVVEILKLRPKGLDYVFECAGELETLDQAAAVLKPGGMLVIVGIPEADRISFLMDPMRRKELTVRNVRRQNERVGPAIRMVASGKADVGSLVTHHFAVEQSQQAFDTVADYRDGVIKAIIDFSKE